MATIWKKAPPRCEGSFRSYKSEEVLLLQQPTHPPKGFPSVPQVYDSENVMILQGGWLAKWLKQPSQQPYLLVKSPSARHWRNLLDHSHCDSWSRKVCKNYFLFSDNSNIIIRHIYGILVYWSRCSTTLQNEWKKWSVNQKLISYIIYFSYKLF